MAAGVKNKTHAGRSHSHRVLVWLKIIKKPGKSNGLLCWPIAAWFPDSSPGQSIWRG